ncbi:O-antigen ligase family protein [Candidatus Margulisiibacteriota bacterium]
MPFQHAVIFITLFFCGLFSVAYVVFNEEIPLIKRICQALLLFVLTGVPTAFSSITRSVFEIGKMNILFYAQIFIIALYFTDRIYSRFSNVNDFVVTLGRYITLKKSFINRFVDMSIAAWLFLNLLSTIFSPNKYLSLIGAYDRWEGIILVYSYIVFFLMIVYFVNSIRSFLWFLCGFFLSTLYVAVYGVLQSFGIDFMNWSADPTGRVFASINNPVHMSAYVAMLIPLAIGILFFYYTRYMKQENEKNTEQYQQDTTSLFIAIAAFVFTFIAFYVANIISFGRATWLGFSAASALFFIVAFNLYFKKREFSDDDYPQVFRGSVYTLVLFSALIALWFLFYIFHIETFGRYVFIGLFTLILTIGVLVVWQLSFSLRALIGFGFILFFSNLQFVLSQSKPLFLPFLQLQTTEALIIAIFLLVGFFFISTLLKLKQQHVVLTIVILSLFVIVLFLNNLAIYTEMFTKKEDGEVIGKRKTVISRKVTSYQTVAKDSARHSMLKTSVPWILEHPLLGTGPGTIKAFYPTYRRPDYGKLEGGHNYTPDKLHNEYANTAATRGITGFLIYYLLFIPGVFFYVFKYYFSIRNKPERFILAGLICGVLVYLGQVLFNFGVVATKVLFYELLALAVAFTRYRFYSENSNESV